MRLSRACATFEQRARQIKSPRGTNPQLLEHALAHIVGDYTVAELEKRCPGVSRALVRQRLKEPKEAGSVERIGRRPEAKWRRKVTT